MNVRMYSFLLAGMLVAVLVWLVEGSGAKQKLARNLTLATGALNIMSICFAFLFSDSLLRDTFSLVLAVAVWVIGNMFLLAIYLPQKHFLESPPYDCETQAGSIKRPDSYVILITKKV